ncbi:SRPBCC family protein [Faunimonas sp. B44]|uniref:SRPBCC family protein n=1 Tax=Faunimonas sp. B44 TaxID=3461493 RepID=UPI004044E941
MLVKLAALGAALLLFGATVADAHGPTRKKVTESVEINAPAEKVWALVGDFQDMSWHPAVESTAGEGGSETGATRTLTLQGGGTIAEELAKHEPEKMSYSYRITDVDVTVLPVTNYSSTLTVKPGEGGKSVLEWRGAFYRGFPNNNPPPELSDEAAMEAVSGVYRAGLDAVKAKIESGS